MVQLADLFSVPEMGLLCNVTEYFLQNHIDYHPEILFRDVKVSNGKCNLVIYFYNECDMIFIEFGAKLSSYNAQISSGKCV